MEKYHTGIKNTIFFNNNTIIIKKTINFYMCSIGILPY